MPKRWLGAILVTIGLTSLVTMFACMGGGPAGGGEPLEVTYYYLPG